MELVRGVAMDSISYTPGSEIILYTLLNPSLLLIPYLLVQTSSQNGAGA